MKTDFEDMSWMELLEVFKFHRDNNNGAEASFCYQRLKQQFRESEVKCDAVNAEKELLEEILRDAQSYVKSTTNVFISYDEIIEAVISQYNLNANTSQVVVDENGMLKGLNFKNK